MASRKLKLSPIAGHILAVIHEYDFEVDLPTLIAEVKNKFNRPAIELQEIDLAIWQLLTIGAVSYYDATGQKMASQCQNIDSTADFPITGLSMDVAVGLTDKGRSLLSQ